MAATQLSIYNNALVKHLGEKKLSSLTENRKPRRVLDTIWDSDFVKSCLEEGYWNFATRTFSSEYNSSIDPDFGYKYAHDKPDDWVKTSGISLDDYFSTPLQRYWDESEYWWTDAEVIYVRMISDDDSYGGDMSSWPESFVDYVEKKLAAEACMAITQSKSKTKDLERMAEVALKNARNKDALNDPPTYPPTGSWVRARRGRRNWEPPTNIRTQ